MMPDTTTPVFANMITLCTSREQVTLLFGRSIQIKDGSDDRYHTEVVLSPEVARKLKQLLIESLPEAHHHD